MRSGQKSQFWLLNIAIFVICVNVINALGVPPPQVRSEFPSPEDGSSIFFDDVIRADDGVDYRLPNETKPINYDVTLRTQVHSGVRDFTGTVSIDIEVVEQTTKIVLHARQLKDFEASILSPDNPTSYPMTCEYEEAREFLSCSRTDGSALQVQSKWTLTINYAGVLRTDNGGFYLSTYEDENGNKRYLATTQFESTNARHGFPCYDEPAKRATFTITIEHDSSYHAISNMPVDDTQSTSTRTVFKETLEMSTYLIAFIVSDFKYTEGQLYGLPQRIYSRPGTEHEQEFALISGMLILQRLAEYYDVAYPLPKEDQVAVPDFAAGAMENWGLVTYREEYLLYNTETSAITTQTNIANIIAHEYTHQWFGNLVAVKWWTYLWLKESFAQLYSWISLHAAYPEWDCIQHFHTSDYQSALNNDASSSPRPMTHYVQTPSEISNLYDTVSYAKGASVLDMWRHALTDDVFRQGLHYYLMEKQFNNGEEDDLFAAIQKSVNEATLSIPKTVQEMLKSWTNQGGYPVINVTRNYDDGSFTLTQEAFFNNETLSAPSKLWFIPINYVVGSNPDFRNTIATHYILKEKETKISDAKVSKDEYLLLNKQSTGYYRINYDARNWELITEALKDKYYKIHPRNRAQLMHDAYRFSSSNRLSHETLLSLMTYLNNEDQYSPWSTANTVLTTFNRYLSGDAQYSNFQSYITALVNDPYDRFGVYDISGEHHYRKYTRNVLINLACLAGIKSCLEETNTKLKNLVDSGIPIEPNLQAQTYCNGLRQTADKEFNFVFDKLMGSENQAERRTLISSLGCAQNSEHIKKFVQSSIDDNNNLREQERTTILSAAYTRGEVGLLASIDFLKGNWEAYDNRTSHLSSAIISMSQYVVNEKQEKEILELVDLVKDSGKVAANLESRVKANIASNYAWLDLNRDPIMNWVQSFLNDDNGKGEGEGGGGASITASYILMLMASLVYISRLF